MKQSMDNTITLYSVTEVLPLKLSLIVIMGIGAQWLAWRLQWPAIVLMSLVGLIFGPMLDLILTLDLPQYLEQFVYIFHLDPERDFGPLLRPAIALAVAVILFEGGLNLTFSDLRDSSVPVRSIILIGAPLGWILGKQLQRIMLQVLIGGCRLF